MENPHPSQENNLPPLPRSRSALRAPALARTPAATAALASPALATRPGILAAGVAALAFAAANFGCARVNVDPDTITVQGDAGPATEEGCSPIPDCPNPYEGNPYQTSGRAVRRDPYTHAQIKICEPTPRNFCDGTQDPGTDHCELPVCANATSCDPVRSIQPGENPRVPDRANFPTTSLPSPTVEAVMADDYNYPVIIDNLPDCAADQLPTKDHPCDPIPTCPPDQQLQYCDPLPRCEEGQTPIKCSDGQVPYTSYEGCADHVTRAAYTLSYYGVNLYPLLELSCPQQALSWKPPLVELQCLPIPECGPGEVSNTSVNLSVTMDCGKWGSWESLAGTPNCDQIQSCKD